MIYNRYYLNHFTISVHNLAPSHNTIEKFNAFLEANGLKLNDSGGKAKTSADGLLIQSSTVAEMVDASFDNGSGGTETHSISGSYVEFAERRLLPGEEMNKDNGVTGLKPITRTKFSKALTAIKREKTKYENSIGQTANCIAQPWRLHRIRTVGWWR